MTDLVIKSAVINFDSTGKASSISIDGHRFTNFPAATYDRPSIEFANAGLSVQIEIPIGDLSKGGTLPNYTSMHHFTGKRISVTGHN